MIGELWWSRMVNAVRFLGDVQDAIESGFSVVLNFSDEIPWFDIMLEELSQNLARTSDSRTFDKYEIDDRIKPGEFLFNKYCSEALRRTYWVTKHKSHERFLAITPETTFHHRYLCLFGFSDKSIPSWIGSVSTYHENCQFEEEHANFILITKNANVKSSKYIKCFQYADYVTDYDCMMLCLTMLSSLSCSRTQKLYLSEVASNIANNNAELAGRLVCAELSLAEDPITVAKEIFLENQIDVPNLEKKIVMSVWEAQIKLVFPRLETLRQNLIQKYEKKLQRYLPISNAYERVDKASELEIGQLYYLCQSGCFAEPGEIALLKKMRDARNALAHWNPLSYQQLLELKLF